jgi:hypothetical protein
MPCLKPNYYAITPELLSYIKSVPLKNAYDYNSLLLIINLIMKGDKL